MRILLINQFFWPDSAATSQLLTDLAVGMAERGHEVHVICADSGYANASAGQAPPVQIHRVPSLRFRRSRLGRTLSYLSFYLQAAWLSLTLPRPSLVFTLTTPPLLPLVGTLARTVRGARHYIWEMDVYPDVATSLQYFKPDGFLDRAVGLLADFSRHQSDGIIALGECMKDRLVRRGISPDKIAVADNWADGAAVQPMERPGSPEKLVLLYSGNLGLAHDLDTIAGAMAALKTSDRFSFIFAGGGPRTQQLRACCEHEGIVAAEFRPYVQRASLGESLCAGDIGLVTQNDACCGAVVPSKVYGLLAAGRPVLFIGPAEATPARIIRSFSCGWHIDCGDVPRLVALLTYLAENRAAVHAAGNRAREALLEHYDLPIGVARICNALGVSRAHESLDQQTPYEQPMEEIHG